VSHRARAAAVLAAVLLGGLGWLSTGAAPEPIDAAARRAGLVPHEVVVDGLHLRYVRSGNGPSVVLVHGLASSLITWNGVLPVLARDHDVVAFDLPGFGGSDIPERMVVGDLPAAVLGVMDALGIEKATLIGNSLGGFTSLLAAARAPERIERLVLVDSAGFNLAPGQHPALLRLLRWPLADRVAELPRLRRWLVGLGLRQVFADDHLVTDARIEAYLAPLARPGGAAAVRAVLTAARPSEPTDRIAARVRAPTLVVWGRQDAWIPVAQAERFTAALPHATARILDGCGHMPQEECPEAFLSVVTPFLE